MSHIIYQSEYDRFKDMAKKVIVLEQQHATLVEALQCLVNYHDQDPDLYKGDEDGSFNRLMIQAYKALKTAKGA